jgi:rod shape-determining protein MreC
MDLDIHERQQASSLFAILAFISLLLLIFHKQPWVNDLRSVLQWTTGPTHRFLSEWRGDPAQAVDHSSSSPGLSSQPPLWAMSPESLRAVQLLRADNQRLRDSLAIKQTRWPGAIAARVVGRDPQRWFQEIVIDKGTADGIVTESAVVAVVNGREGLVGRVMDVMDHTAKVLLIQDSLSSVAAHLQGAANEDGVVEGTNGHDLLLKYLDRSSPVKMGDGVVTSGLGNSIPAEIPIGWVQDISLDPRQLFLQARLRSYVSSNSLRIVLVLTPAAQS